MAKKSDLKKEFDKIRRMANSDATLGDLLKKIAEVEATVKGVGKGERTGRFRTPYVDAVPLNSACWAK